MKDMPKGKKRLARIMSIVLVVSIVMALFTNMIIASGLSLNYIEEIKSMYSDGAFKILEIAPSSDTGTIGYYVDGSEPIANWAEDTAGFSTRAVRQSYVTKLINELINVNISSDDATKATPLTHSQDYSEKYPWEKQDESTLVTAYMRANKKTHGYNTMNLDSMEKISGISGRMSEGVYDKVGTFERADILNYDSDTEYYVKNVDKYELVEDWNTIAEGTEIFTLTRYNLEEYEYDAVYKYKLSATGELNYFDYDSWFKNIQSYGGGVTEKGRYKTTRIIRKGDLTDGIMVFGSSEENWNTYGENAACYDLNKIHSTGIQYYTIEVDPGETYNLSFHADIKKGKGQVTIIPFTSEGKTVVWQPNYSKEYWYANEYITKSGDYDYTFTTNANSKVKYVQVRFDVDSVTSAAEFSKVRLYKFLENKFDFDVWNNNEVNKSEQSGSVGTSKVTIDQVNDVIKINMVKGKLFSTKYAGDGSTFRMECAAGKTYVLTYHVENSTDDGGQSTVKVYGYDKSGKAVMQGNGTTNILNSNDTTTTDSGTFSYKFTPALGTSYLAISFGISSSRKGNISHTATFTDIAIAEMGDYEQSENPTHVQVIDYFKYGKQNNNLGDNIFNVGEWYNTSSSNTTSSSFGTVTIDETDQTITVKTKAGIDENCTAAYYGDYNSGFYTMKVTPGMKYNVTYYVKNSEPNKDSSFYVIYSDASKNVLKDPKTNDVLNEGFRLTGSGTKTVDITIPSGVEYMQVRFGGRSPGDGSDEYKTDNTVIFSNIQIRPYDRSPYYYAVTATPMSKYIEEGTIGAVGFEYDSATTYYDSTGKQIDINNCVSGDAIFIKNESGYFEQTGTIGKSGFVVESDKDYYIKKVVDEKDKYYLITDWSTLKFGTVIYSFFYEMPIYRVNKEEGKKDTYTYVGQVTRDYSYAGTVEQDEFEIDPTVQYYVYDSANDTYELATEDDYVPGTLLFIEDTKFSGVDGYDYLLDTEEYVFLSVDYTVDPPISADYDDNHPYCCTSTEFRKASEEETPFFIEDGIDYYKYVGSGYGDYKYLPNAGFDDTTITIATQTIFYKGGFVNNNWFLKYVFDYTADEIAQGKAMGISVETVDPAWLSNKTKQKMEAYLGSFDLIVISSGLGVLRDASFTDDITNDCYDVLYDVINGSDYHTPCVVDSSLITLNAQDSMGNEITNIPKLAKVLTDGIANGGVKDQIYSFNFSDLGLNGANTSIGNNCFNNTFSEYGFIPEDDYTGEKLDETNRYYEVYSEIIYERKLNLKVTVPVKISEATAIRCILNYRGRLKANNKRVIRILDIEPYTNDPYRNINDKFLIKIATTSKDYFVTPGLTVDEVKSWFKAGDLTYLDGTETKETKIEIVTMAVSEFNGINEDLVEQYDVLYIGASLKNMNWRIYGDGSYDGDQYYDIDDETDTYILDNNGQRIVNGEWGNTIIPNYNDDEMDGMYYTNVGDLFYVENASYEMTHRNTSKLGGLLASDYHYASGTKGAWELAADDEPFYNSHDRANTAVRSSGNDITENKLDEIYEFAEAGHPIIIAGELCNNGWTGSKLGCKIEGSVFKDTSGQTYARIVAYYTGDSLPKGAQPDYTWYGDNGIIKETSSDHSKFVSYGDVDNDGVRECILQFPIDVTNPDDVVFQTYYCQLTAFEFSAGRYKSLTQFTKATSNKLTLDPNTYNFDINISRNTSSNSREAEATLKISSVGKSFKTPDPKSLQVTTPNHTISLGDENNTKVEYIWRSRKNSISGWSVNKHIEYTSYDYNSLTGEFKFKVRYDENRKFIDLGINISSDTVTSTPLFTEAQDAFSNQILSGDSYSYTKVLNFPQFIEKPDKAIAGVKGTDDFNIRSERVDNSSKIYTALTKEIESDNAFVYSTATLKMLTTKKINEETGLEETIVNNDEAMRLLNAVNVSKPEIVVNKAADTNVLSVFGTGKKLEKWNSDDVIEVINNTIEFDFSINNLTDNHVRTTKYDVNVYIDLDADGNYTEEEKLSVDDYKLYDVSGATTPVESGQLKSSYYNDTDKKTYTYNYRVQIEVGGDYIGMLPWKVEVVNAQNEDIHNSFCGYAYNRPSAPYEINVLQILPMTVKESKGTLSSRKYTVTKWDTSLAKVFSDTSEQKASIFLCDAFTKLGDNYKREIATDSTGRKYIKLTIGSDYILNIYVTSVFDLQGKGSDGGELETGCTKTSQQLYDQFNTYDMLIIGYGDSYATGVSEELAQAISDFISTGKHVLYTHDATDQFNNFYPAQRQADGYYLNLYVRDDVGMDKYGITYSILSHSESYRSNARVSKSYSPARYGYTNNMYTAPTILYHYDSTPIEYKYWKGTSYNGEDGTGAVGDYVKGKDKNGKEITSTNRYPAILTYNNEKWEILYDENTLEPIFLDDYNKKTGEIDQSVVSTYGAERSVCRGVYVYYDSATSTWQIGYDANKQFIFYSGEMIEGWKMGYDDDGHVLTTDNTYPCNLEYVTTKNPDGTETKTWQIDYFGTLNKPQETSVVYSQYGKSKDGNHWYGAYCYKDPETGNWYIGYDAEGHIITYGETYLVDGTEVTYAQPTDQAELKTTNISNFIDLGYVIAYRVNTKCKEVVSEVQGFTNYCMTRYERSFKSDQVNPTAFGYSGSNPTFTSKITQVNKGQITMYPFNLNTEDFQAKSHDKDQVVSRGDEISIAKTHEQYYTLDLTGSKNSDGTYNDDFATVWYCLGGDGYSNNVYNDCSNAYYLYTYKNVTYTGAGHTNNMSVTEAKLFINVIVASHIKSGSSANVSIQDAEGNDVNSIIMKSSTQEMFNDDDDVVVSGKPDITEDEKKIDIHLTNVQCDSYLEVYFMEGENYLEVMYDGEGNPHIVTYNKDLEIIAVDGNSCTETVNGDKIIQTYVDNLGKTHVVTLDATTRKLQYSYVYKNGYYEVCELTDLYRIRQNLHYQMTVYDEAGQKINIVRDNHGNIISVNGNTSKHDIDGLSLFYDKYAKNAVTDITELKSRAATRPILEYDINYKIPDYVFEYLSNKGDIADLKLIFIVVPIEGVEGSQTIGDESTPDKITIVKLGYKELV